MTGCTTWQRVPVTLLTVQSSGSVRENTNISNTRSGSAKVIFSFDFLPSLRGGRTQEAEWTGDAGTQTGVVMVAPTG